MKREYTEEDRARTAQAQAGTTTADICRKLGVIEQTFYTWKRKYRGGRRDRAPADETSLRRIGS